MNIIHHPSRLADFLSGKREEGLSIGFVPTMGALHEGHLQLIKTSVEQSDLTVCSIFVNPTQFNDPLDYKKYPDRREADIRLLVRAGADILFLPGLQQLYPNGTSDLETYELGHLDSLLEGRYRPGHFQGVCQVMYRLLNAVQPDLLFMGQKDYQQCMVVKKLLDGYISRPVRLITCPTVREKDGLAMSSRNLRLKAGERPLAAFLYRCLQQICHELRPGPLATIKASARQLLETKGLQVDYVEIAHRDTLQPLESWNGQEPLVALVAAFLGEVRLIDNMLLTNRH